jgi:hypothetical protein
VKRPVIAPALLMLSGKVPKPEPAVVPARGASKEIIFELAFCAAGRTGTGRTPNKITEVKNVNVPNFMLPPRRFL